jgi:hypothetical protein
LSTEFRKHRDFTYGKNTGHVIAHRSGAILASDRMVDVVASGDQTTWSTETLFPLRQRQVRWRKRRGTYDSMRAKNWDFGGPFTTVKRSYWDDGAIHRIENLAPVQWLGNTYGYSGPILGQNPSVGTGGFNLYPSYSELALHEEMRAAGTVAIANTIPTNPSVGVGQLIGESMERIPRLPGAALFGRPGNVSKKFADEYLNVEFGLKPLLSDIDGIATTIKNQNKILEQLERDSGRLIRRRYEFPVETTNELLANPTAGREVSYPLLATRQYEGAGAYTHTRTTVKRMWFSGAYTYHYSTRSDLMGKLKRAEQAGNRLFGLRLTPSLAWELAPWSWAADWVANTGEVLENLSALSRDGLVLRWGYIMCDLHITDTHMQRINLRNNGFRRIEQRFTTHVKKRLPATPYGFGMDPDWQDLSPRQLAILGALGISRGR